jgi:hypothetical protein
MELALMIRSSRSLFLAGVLAGMAHAPALSKALEPAECKALDVEVATLEAAGIKLDIEKGPEWGKANLAADRIERIRHYFEIREKVLFRCPELIAARTTGEAKRQKAAGGKKVDGEEGGETTASGDESTNEFEIVVPANRSQNK